MPTAPSTRAQPYWVRWRLEVSGHLVVPPVFKTGEAEHLGLAGSIPVHLRGQPAGTNAGTTDGTTVAGGGRRRVGKEPLVVARRSATGGAAHRRPAGTPGPGGRLDAPRRA